jgi:hypothetical protein
MAYIPRVTAPNEIPDEWDFYPCRVDDAAASIFLNLWYARNPTPAGIDTLYWVRIRMVTPGEHGMGVGEEAEVTYPLIDELTDGAAAAQLHYVGRLRNLGAWQLVFYGPAEKTDQLASLCGALERAGDRTTQHGDKPDPNWGYYRDFLMPPAERRQWMHDRRLVDTLTDHGDTLTMPRRVDHWAYFSSAEGRDAYVAAATAQGFSVQDVIDDADYRGMAHGAQVHRVDSVRLDDIHAAVMVLHKLAATNGGDYDGWETSVEKPDV